MSGFEHNNFLTGKFTDSDAEVEQLRKDAYLINGSNTLTASLATGAQSIFDAQDIVLNHQASGQQPPAGKLSLYSKADDLLYIKDSVGTETQVGGGAGGDVTAAANFATDNLLIRSDGILKGVQASGITLSNTDELTNVQRISLASPTLAFSCLYGFEISGQIDQSMFGYRAGKGNTGIANTGFGKEVFGGTTSGAENSCAFGSNALLVCQGNFNNAYGNFSLRSSTSGTQNCMFGYISGRDLTTANQCAGFGHEVLKAITTGGNNTGIGWSALDNLLTGTGNTSLGHSAGSNLTSGSDNLYLNNLGVASESSTMRLGSASQTSTFIAGVSGVVPSLAATAIQDVSIDSTGQTGSASLSTSSTGLVSGGVLAINGGDATLFDISDGFGFIFDAATLVKKRIAWTGLTGESSGAHVGDLTYVSINSSAVPIFFTTEPTNVQKRDAIFLGILVHTGASANFVLVDTMPIMIQSPVNLISDFAVLVGRAKYSGMVAGSNNLLTVFSTAGQMFEFGGNYNTNKKDPNFVSIPLVDTNAAGTYNRVLLDDSFTPTLTNILTTDYDVAGTLTTMPGANDFQTMRIYQTSNGTLLVQPGQVLHNSLAEALSAINTETFITAPSMLANGLLIGYLTVQDGTTDLSNVADAAFTQGGKFQATSGGSSGGGDVFGPASSTTNHLAVYADSTGKVLKDAAGVLLTDTSNISGVATLDINHTATENDDHALEIDVDAAGFGDVRGLDIQYITGNIIAGVDEEGILVNVDQSASTGGRFVALEVLGTDVGSAEVDGLECGVQCHPIRQQSGVFANATALFNLAVDVTVALSSGGAGNITLFVADNDTFTIQGAAKFSEIEIILDIVASGPGILPLFEFSNGASPTTWATFSPIDGTNQFRSSGVILWELVDIPSWVVGTSGNFEIRISRTRNSLTTSPRCDLCQISATEIFNWDKDGNLNVNDITCKNINSTGSTVSAVVTSGAINSINLISSTGGIDINSSTQTTIGSSGTIALAAPTGAGSFGASAALTLSSTANSVFVSAASEILLRSQFTELRGLTATANPGKLRIHEGGTNGSNYIEIESPAALGSNYNVILPGTVGTLGDVLTYGTPPNLIWSHPSATQSALPNNYFTGLNILNNGLTGKTLELGECRNSLNTFDIILAGNVNISIATSGSVNLLDTGTVSANSFYFVFVIADSTGVAPTGGLFSLSSTAPTLPAGYDIFRLCGSTRINATSQFFSTYSKNKGIDRWRYYEETNSTLLKLIDGSAIVYDPVDFSTLVPPTSTFIEINVIHTATDLGRFCCIFNGLSGSSVIASPRKNIIYGGTNGAEGNAGSIFKIDTNGSQVCNYGNSHVGGLTDILLIAYLDTI